MKTKKREQFAYGLRPGASDLKPLLPICLFGRKPVEALALVDSGASVSVLPRGLGEKLGLDWRAAKPFGSIGILTADTKSPIVMLWKE